jgi:membrane-bound lytic murein transglycosylase D
MKGLIAGLLVVFVALAAGGCSTTGKVATSESPVFAEESPRFENTPEPAKVLPKEPQKKALEVVKAPAPVAPKVAQGIIEEEDDIAPLFREEDFQKFDIPIVFNDAVRYYIGWFTTEKRKIFGNWLKRSRRYIPVIKEILQEHGMPEDLVYLAMIESGFNPKAYSTAKACGPWQFIYATGDRYGLKVNSWIDERRDPEKSTVAAAKYLKDLFNQFGCWYLAAAGYNAGEKRVERAIEKHNTNDFWELARYNALPKETREYIPKLIAAAVVAKDPEKYGFGSIMYDSPLRFAQVKVPRGTPLSTIAKASGVDVETVRSCNPEILRGITPPDMDGYVMKLPYPVNVTEFKGSLEDMLAREKKIKNVVTYKVKKRDTLASVMKKYKVTYEELSALNCDEGELKVRSGMVLNIPRFSSPAVASQKAEKSSKTVVAGQKPVKQTLAVKVDTTAKTAKGEKKERQTEQKPYHVVKKGETLSTISSKYGIDVASLKSENNLKSDKVYPNMKLKLVSHVREKKKAGVRYHVVQKGETLSTISSKYGIDVASLKSENNLKNNKVYPKMKLKVVTEEEG